MLNKKAVMLLVFAAAMFVTVGCGSRNHQFWIQPYAPAMDSGFAMTTNAVESITIRDAGKSLADNCGLLNSHCDMERRAGFGTFKGIKRAFTKHGYDHVDIYSIPPGKYYLVGWSIINNGQSGATTGYYFKDESTMPVIEVKPHEITLVGELTKPAGSQGYKLLATPAAKNKIVELVKYELNERTDNDADEVAVYKTWLPAMEKAAAHLQ